MRNNKSIFNLFLGAIFLLLLVGSFSCAHKKNVFGDPSSQYHKLLNSLTQRSRLYGLEKVQYDTAVTYKSSELRQAYVNEYAEKYRLSEAERAKVLADELAEAEKFDVFMVSHFATDKETGRIAGKGKVWKVTMSVQPADEGEWSDPEVVESLSASNDPVLRYFYPHILPWAKNYVVKFPRVEKPAKLYLRMAGVAGHLRFAWSTEEPTP